MSHWITKVAHVVWENAEERQPPLDEHLLVVAKAKDNSGNDVIRQFIATYEVEDDEATWWYPGQDVTLDSNGWKVLFFARLPESPK